MSFFRDYLQNQGQQPDYQFAEIDESWFVFALLLLRLGFSPDMWNLLTGRGKRFRGDDPLANSGANPEFQSALLFVSKFLCFFVPKPQRYQQQISSFTEYFIPGFASDQQKQELLIQSALPSFSSTPSEIATWRSVTEYFKPV